MDIENFIAEFKKTFVYDMLSMSLKDEQLFEHVVDDDGVLWFKEQTRQMWLMWEKAKAQAVPEVLRKFCNEHKDPAWRGRLTEYDRGYSDCCIAVLKMIELQEPTND